MKNNSILAYIASVTIIGGTLFFGNSALAQKKKTAPSTRAAQPMAVTDPNSTYISSYSSNYKHEVDVNLSQGAIHSYKLGDSSITSFDAFASYHYFWKDHMQLGGEVGLISYNNYDSSGKASAVNLIQLMGVFTYNLDADLKNSYFGQVGLGMHPAYKKNDGKYQSQFSFFFDAGKRFALWDHVTYRPLFRIAKYGDADMEFFIIPVNISLMF